MPVSVRRNVRIAVRLSPVVALIEDLIAAKPKPVTFLGRLVGSCPLDPWLGDDFKAVGRGNDKIGCRDISEERPSGDSADLGCRSFSVETGEDR